MNIILISVLSYITNIPFGRWRKKYKKFSLPWFLLIHATIPFIIALRVYLDTPYIYAPLFIMFAVLGQITGTRLAKN
jgi:hypothetical protein